MSTYKKVKKNHRQPSQTMLTCLRLEERFPQPMLNMLTPGTLEKSRSTRLQACQKEEGNELFKRLTSTAASTYSTYAG